MAMSRERDYRDRDYRDPYRDGEYRRGERQLRRGGSVGEQQPDHAIGELFEACDLDGSGYIEEGELANICSELSEEEIHDVFRELDRDKDGRISIQDFSEGFQSVSETLLSLSRRKRRLHSQNSFAELDAFMTRLGTGFEYLNCQEHVCELYQQLHASEVPQLIALFETIILGVTKDLKSQHAEVNRLEKTLRRTSDANQEHLKQLEDEMDTQMIRIEQRIRQEERDSAELEKLDMRRQFETEISELQANLKRFSKLESRFQRDNGREEMVAGLRNQVDSLMQEKRRLKSALTESETNLAILRSDLATTQSEYEEQRGAIVKEKSAISEYEQEHESLTRQLHLLQDANKKLQDTNDDLRAALEASKQMNRGMNKSRKHFKQGSFMNDYIDEEMPTENDDQVDTHAQKSDALSLPQSKRGSNSHGTERTKCKRSRTSRAPSFDEEALAVCDPGMRASPYQQTMDYDSWDVDSGNSTMRDPYEDSEYDPNSIEDDICRLGSPTPIANEDEHMQNLAETDVSRDGSVSDITVVRANSYMAVERPPTPKRASPSPSQRSNDSRASRPGSGKRRALPTLPMRPITPANAPPERMYKIVMAGDAAVGKSSFILRLCKGIFHNNLNSTLGVDFQMKTLEVDGQVTSLQLWDTAGQERFRSIAKSYFRRADGVLMLYDVTCDRSFINVRDWMDAVQDGAQKELPIMLCGNKADARAETISKGKRCVTTADGERLAKSYNALFIETSAKDGDNILEAVIELARRLHEKEDLEVKSVGMKLEDQPHPKEESKCCNL
ncbi:ras and EF-hand domain-containing protein homolog isoform X2 [Ptychodera flava]|uniref:ras and EF-hand domain-containing protein homolog isoform X2 n=1 Tax=Ptychodera flava TaxID=63121 RepID=UPI00396A01D9